MYFLERSTLNFQILLHILNLQNFIVKFYDSVIENLFYLYVLCCIALDIVNPPFSNMK